MKSVNDGLRYPGTKTPVRLPPIEDEGLRTALRTWAEGYPVGFESQAAKIERGVVSRNGVVLAVRLSRQVDQQVSCDPIFLLKGDRPGAQAVKDLMEQIEMFTFCDDHKILIPIRSRRDLRALAEAQQTYGTLHPPHFQRLLASTAGGIRAVLPRTGEAPSTRALHYAERLDRARRRAATALGRPAPPPLPVLRRARQAYYGPQIEIAAQALDRSRRRMGTNSQDHDPARDRAQLIRQWKQHPGSPMPPWAREDDEGRVALGVAVTAPGGQKEARIYTSATPDQSFYVTPGDPALIAWFAVLGYARVVAADGNEYCSTVQARKVLRPSELGSGFMRFLMTTPGVTPRGDVALRCGHRAPWSEVCYVAQQLGVTLKMANDRLPRGRRRITFL